MATRTFLQLVNDVLTELREPTVATVTESDYSTLIMRFVNSAKRAVEQAWQWSTLRETISVSTVAGDVQYTLTGSRERFALLQRPADAYNKTQKAPLEELTRSSHRELFYGDFTDTTGVLTGNVTSFSFHEALDSGARQVNVYPVPTGVEVLKFHGYNPPDDWTAGTDICYIPYEAIVQLAVALARGERGEDGGIAASEAAAFAAKAASEAIAIDAAKYDEDTDWVAV